MRLQPELRQRAKLSYRATSPQLGGNHLNTQTSPENTALTVVTAKDEAIQPVETKEIQEIPRKRGHPADVHVRRLYSPLKHRLEAQRKRERQFYWEQVRFIHSRGRKYALRTKPWKKKLIQPIMTICGTIMTFSMSILRAEEAVETRTHLGFHARHHAVHCRWVRHRIRGAFRRVSFTGRAVFKKCPRLECLREMPRDGLVVRWGYRRVCSGGPQDLGARQGAPGGGQHILVRFGEALGITDCSRTASRGSFLGGLWSRMTT